MDYKISIIVPVYNVENHIDNALNSIERQTIGLSNLQVIMVDDFSTDNSGNIIEEYAKKYDNFQAIHLSENSGAAGKPRNIGMDLAEAEYMMFLDPDDYYTDDACEVLYNKISSESADIVFGYYQNYRNHTPLPVKKPFQNKKEINVDNIHEETHLLTIPPSIWTKIFKTSFLKENNMTFHEGIPGQDLVFVDHALLMARGIIFLNDYIVCNRVLRDSGEDRSITFSHRDKYLPGVLEAYKRLFEVFMNSDCNELISIGFQNHILFWMRQFAAAELNVPQKRELLLLATSLFIKLQKNGLSFKDKKWDALFTFISNEKLDEALILMEVIQSSTEREKKIRKKLKNKENQVARLQTVKGWSAYKSKNLILRFKKRFGK